MTEDAFVDTKVREFEEHEIDPIGHLTKYTFPCSSQTNKKPLVLKLTGNLIQIIRRPKI